MSKILILLVVIVGIIAAAQLSKVYKLSAELRGHREEDISSADSKFQSSLMIVFMLVFYASVIWQIIVYGDYLPPAATEHGDEVDTLMSFNLYLILFAFFIVNTLLFVFASKYRYDKNRKGYFFPHDNRLELIWTVIPTIVLAVIIIYGLRTWMSMTGEASDEAIRVELYSKQFDWTARYTGEDGEFGATSFNAITPSNPLGILTQEGVEEAVLELDGKIAKIQDELTKERGRLLQEKAVIESQLHDNSHSHHGHDESHVEDHEKSPEHLSNLENRLKIVNELLAGETTILTDGAIEAKEDKIYRLQRHRQRLIELEPFNYNETLSAWDAGRDDQLVKGEFHIPVGKEIEFVFRSRDVIHSAYMPHFRAQMNCVPGVPTRLKLTPTITTDSMRTILDDPDFNYVLLCNKVCGSAHFNMGIDIIVESEEQYNVWLNEQKKFINEE
jgi:cytochrome c oxidase subunit 2